MWDVRKEQLWAEAVPCVVSAAVNCVVMILQVRVRSRAGSGLALVSQPELCELCRISHTSLAPWSSQLRSG